ncbi:hypothetical protein ABH942_000747 [Flavobacterium sp. 28YEA47A]|uniref:hypothetical protein n=1 Tax=Flavobacterium sp. 28YEA47A TaxID=3156276 RepID=UPI00351863E9
MKKILLIIGILLQVGLVYAQERDNVGHRVGSWNISSHNCFKGLSWKIRKSYYTDNSDKYTNEIEIKNNYGSTITFSYNMSENANETTTRYRKTLTPGQTYTSTYCPNVNLVIFYVNNVCFNNNNCKDGCYAQCDNGSPNQPNCGEANSSTTNNNQKGTKQNDHTEYNQSKADLEKQMADKNAEIQKQNVENRKQQFNRLYNEGISLKNNGNFGVAKNRFNDALKYASNDNERQQVQNALNQNKADGNTYVAQTAVELTNTISDGIQKQKEWSEARKREKEERLQRIEDDKRNEEQKFINEIDLADKGDYKMQSWVAFSFYGKQKYESAEEYYKMAIANKEYNTSSGGSLNGVLASCYAINGKYLEQWNELNKKDALLKQYLNGNGFERAMLILFSKKYEIDVIVTDEMRKSAIEDLKNDSYVKIYHESDAKAALAYFQITGEYEHLGIPKNETVGLEALTKSTSNQLASYFVGSLYLQGIGLKKTRRKHLMAS